METDRVHRVRLELGDMGMYQGSLRPHWRNPLPKGRVDQVLLLFYVPLSFRGGLEPIRTKPR